MKKAMLPPVLLIACLWHGAHAEDGWVRVASSDGAWKWDVDVKAGSLEISQTRAEVPIAVVIGRITNTGSNNVSLFKWYVPLKDCVAESGIVV